MTKPAQSRVYLSQLGWFVATDLPAALQKLEGRFTNLFSLLDGINQAIVQQTALFLVLACHPSKVNPFPWTVESSQHLH